VEADNGADEYYVYACATMLRRAEPNKGDNKRVFPVLAICVLDSAETLNSVRGQYREVQAAFHKAGGSAKYREFPFEDKFWKFNNYPNAARKARELQRQSWMKYWPGVLNLEAEKATAATTYYLFAFRELNVVMDVDDDDDDYDLTFRATKRPWRVVIFDDEKVTLAAKRLYREYIAAHATLTDGLGHQVGKIEPHVEKAATFVEARRKARDLRSLLDARSAKP
jgi:hypothetical protein